MNESILGSLSIILRSLILSLELYGLKIVQCLEMQKGIWKTNAIDYASETPISLALILTVAVIIYGIRLVVSVKKNTIT